MHITPNTATYLIFARTPRLGQGKTRLAATIGAEAALLLYEAMLTDTLRSIHARNAANVLLFTYPPDSIAEMQVWCARRGVLFEEVRICPQTGDTLGEQMYCAFRLAEEQGLLPAVILGTDAPTLPQEVWEHAEQTLMNASENTAVIGRADDGGFYALGLTSVDASFFFGNDYSNDTVFERTLAAVRQKCPNITILREWMDIDDEETLRQVVAKARNNQKERHYETVRVFDELFGGK